MALVREAMRWLSQDQPAIWAAGTDAILIDCAAAKLMSKIPEQLPSSEPDGAGGRFRADELDSFYDELGRFRTTPLEAAVGSGLQLVALGFRLNPARNRPRSSTTRARACTAAGVKPAVARRRPRGSATSSERPCPRLSATPLVKTSPTGSARWPRNGPPTGLRRPPSSPSGRRSPRRCTMRHPRCASSTGTCLLKSVFRPTSRRSGPTTSSRSDT